MAGPDPLGDAPALDRVARMTAMQAEMDRIRIGRGLPSVRKFAACLRASDSYTEGTAGRREYIDGSVDRLENALAGAEMTMRDVGMDIAPGSGVGAAVEYFQATSKTIPTRDMEGVMGPGTA